MTRFTKLCALAMALCLALSMLTACGITQQDRYEQAQLHLGYRDYESARSLFAELGEYEESGSYALYCSGLLALQAGDYARASADFANLAEFRHSPLYLSYVDALILEQEGEWEAALGLFASLGSFEDSADKAAHLQQLIPQRDYASAQTLMAVGQYQQAWDAFAALGDYQDSAQLAAACQEKLFESLWSACQQAFQRGDYEETLKQLEDVSMPLTESMARQLLELAEKCRAALYERARRSEAEGLSAAQETLALYDALGSYSDSLQRAQALRTQYGVSMQLHDFDGQWQYVSLGAWPKENPLLWRVVKCYDHQVLLLADTIMETRPLCQPEEAFTTYNDSSLRAWLCDTFAAGAFSAEQQQALCGEDPVFLLSKEEAALLNANPHRQATGSQHALEQGLRQSSQGTSWWWLRDQGEMSGCQSIVYFSGSIYENGVQAQDTQTGVRPALWLDLDQYSFTEGTGTLDDPSR